MSSCPLSVLNLSATTLEALSKANFISTSDLENVSAATLMRSCQLDREEALTVAKAAKAFHNVSLSDIKCITALDLYNSASVTNPLITFVQSLDTLLNGGLPCGQITEVLGLPGSGKTQFCLQLAADVQIPSVVGGTEGRALFIDTQGDFSSYRFQQISESMVKHLKHTMAEVDPLGTTIPTVESIAGSTLVYRIFDYVELLALLYCLEDIIQKSAQNPTESPIKLIVLDSIAAPFKTAFGDDFATRSRVLHEVMTLLRVVACQYEVAVVITNQMVVKPNISKAVPLLGESFGQYSHHRFVIDHCRDSPKLRTLSITKSCCYPIGEAVFEISDVGIRGR
ncbi:hypothetical protein RCL1_004466 [Eukaryota sp. TZLM3-RCL]